MKKEQKEILQDGKKKIKWKKNNTENGLEGKQQTNETVERWTEESREENFKKCYICKISLDTEGWKPAVLTQCSQQKGMIQQQGNSSSDEQ